MSFRHLDALRCNTRRRFARLARSEQPSVRNESDAGRTDARPRTKTYDVLVIGGGNAALCAAITARQAGASVLLVEQRRRAFRGGNSRHTRNLRAMHEQPTATLTEAYLEDEYWDDLLRVTGGKTDEQLARMTIRGSSRRAAWMEACGVHFQPSLTGTLNLSRTNAFFLGGGKALVNAYYVTAERIGVDVLYDTEVLDLTWTPVSCASVDDHQQGFSRDRPRQAVVAATGGFQANIEWLKQYWGDAADNFLIRGMPYNGRSPEEPARSGGRIGRRSHAMPRGGDRRARAEIRWRHRHPAGLRAVQHRRRPGRRALLRRGRGCLAEALRHLGPPGRTAARADRVFDHRCKSRKGCSCRRCFPPIRAATLGELAERSASIRKRWRGRCKEYNAAVRPGISTTRARRLPHRGNYAAEDNWARAIDTPPFTGYPLRPGITFTYLGVKVDEKRAGADAGRPARGQPVRLGRDHGRQYPGRGYPAGFGMTIGTVFGRIAGREAAQFASN